MTAIALLTELRSRGIRLEPLDGRLRYDAPAGALTIELREAMAAVKTDLIDLVAIGAECTDCHVAPRPHPHTTLCDGCSERRKAAIPVPLVLRGPPPKWSCMTPGCREAAADPDRGRRFYCAQHEPSALPINSQQEASL